MAKHKKTLLILALIFLPFCLYAAGLKEAYNCGQAAQMLQINADAYHNPAPTVEDILAGVSPYMPLTRMEGCKMLLRAFGPLPDVQEGIRYLVKYRDCAFTDVPEEGKEAVENLTNAGLYIPEDDTKFGPNELMTESELAVLVDRIHAYLQSSPKDDFYSWSNAELLNDPDFYPWKYDFYNTTNGNNGAMDEWVINFLNDCLENPDTPEKKNIVALLSTYMDMEERKNSMTYIQPMVDAIWNASDFYELMDVLADIRRETGLEVFLNRNAWTSYELMIDIDTEGRVHESYGYLYLSDMEGPESVTPGHYFHDAKIEQRTKLLSLLGIDKEEAEAAVRDFLYGILGEAYPVYIDYDCFDLEFTLTVDNIPEELSFIPLARYLERAGYGTDLVCFFNIYESLAYLQFASLEENLAGFKSDCIYYLIKVFSRIVSPEINDAVAGFWDAFYAADPDNYFTINNLDIVLFCTQNDIAQCYMKTEGYRELYEKLETLCNYIKSYYHQMLENATWLSDYARQCSLNKLDNMQFELLVPQDMSKVLHVEYVAAEDGGTLFENYVRYQKARYNYLIQENTAYNPEYFWSVYNCWLHSEFFYHNLNLFFVCMELNAWKEHAKATDYETLLAYIGTSIAHEISHGFDYSAMMYGNMLTPEDVEEFDSRLAFLADYISGCEIIPGVAIEDGYQILNEAAADLAALKCVMNIASELPDFDYDIFFRSYADLYAITCTRQGCILYILPDEHPNGRCRVNKELSLVDEFYTTYDIKEGDAMYVSPENRPYIW
jgi:predicted metalloendopeptidase